MGCQFTLTSNIYSVSSLTGQDQKETCTIYQTKDHIHVMSASLTGQDQKWEKAALHVNETLFTADQSSWQAKYM